MGLLVWIILGVVILAIVGLGVGTFFSGVFKGAQMASQNPVVKNATQEAKQFLANNISSAVNKVNSTHLP